MGSVTDWNKNKDKSLKKTKYLTLDGKNVFLKAKIQKYVELWEDYGNLCTAKLFNGIQY